MKKGYFLAAIAAGCWATLGIIGRFIYATGLDTLTVVTGRAIFAFILTGVFLLLTRKDAIKINPRHLPHFFILGLFGLAGNFISFLSAIKYTTVATTTILLYTYPAIVNVTSALIFKEKLDAKKIVALAMTALGCFFAVGAYAPSSLKLNLPGVLFGLGTGSAMAFYSIYGKLIMKTYSSYTLSFWGFLFAALIFISVRPGSVANLAGSSAYSLFLVFLAALVPTLLSYGLYTIAVNDIGPSRAAITCTLEPVMAAVFSFLILGETMSLIQWLGIAVVVAGVCILNLPAGNPDAAVQVKRDVEAS